MEQVLLIHLPKEPARLRAKTDFNPELIAVQTILLLVLLGLLLEGPIALAVAVRPYGKQERKAR